LAGAALPDGAALFPAENTKAAAETKKKRTEIVFFTGFLLLDWLNGNTQYSIP